MSQPKPIDDFGLWLSTFQQPGVLVELGTLLLCVLLAWGVSALLRRALARSQSGSSVLFGERLIDGALFPVLLLALAYVARTLLLQFVPLAVFRVAIPVLVSLVVIRIGVKVLQVAFPGAAWVRPLERSISWMAWGAMVLWVSGLLPVVLHEMDQISWKLGNGQVSLRTLLEGVITAGAVLIVALWISSAIEARLLRSVTGGELSLRKAISNATRGLLMFVGLMMALTMVGIDLTALSVFGGALGVGLGFGLQKIMANYVSGFIILLDRSIRIGDLISVGTDRGQVQQITTRYTVLRSPSGVQSIVPNETLISSVVQNEGLSDREVRVAISVQVGYADDVERALVILEECARAHERVLSEPVPRAFLHSFGDSGINLELGLWITDPENGTLGIRSAVQLEILRRFRAEGIEIPFPQREIRVLGDTGNVALCDAKA